ncbi:hypothetical protein OS190_13375 [Sulfitobacter sp. F26204]|uniref:hypothetical protein n=1 Tax=Sulfitobacter sp. F26204 TaxID=2996014 RepID=UPI00225DE51A|nr:hypothetical protein [Sulfitobacter sp. F26204]MCX7560562.1 hypothetical protein [Sulfitobacter sp. F26204]
MAFLLQFQIAEAQGHGWPTTEWVAECAKDAVICQVDENGKPNDEGVDVFLTQLREASQFLARAGLLPPSMITRPDNTVGAPYLAYFQDGLFKFADSVHAAGYYRPDVRTLWVDYSQFFAFDTNSSGYSGTAAHELFHAVQESYGLTGKLLRSGKQTKWVTEGTATAVEWLQSGSAQYVGSGLPYLDFPIDDLQSTSGGPGEYATYPFWAFMAKKYGGATSSGVGFFHNFFNVVNELPDSKSVMELVDIALLKVTGAGLYDIYPDFIAEFGSHQGRYKSLSASESSSNLMIVRRELGDANLQVNGTVRPLAAEPFSLTVLDFANSALEIRLSGPDTDGLHLIVDDQRYDTAATGFDGDRNVFYSDQIGEAKPGNVGQKYLIRVVNASKTPIDYRSRDFRLIVTLYSEYAVIGEADIDGPSSADIDKPVEISFDKRSAFLAPYVTDDTLAAGLSDPCALRVDLWNTITRDSLGFELDHDGPITTGEYILATIGEDGSLSPEDYPNQPVAGFVIGAANALSQGYRQQFSARGGVLTIDAITPRWITGSVRIAGTRRYDSAWISGTPVDFPAELKNLEIKVKFSLRHERPMGVGKVLDVRECLEGETSDLRRNGSTSLDPQIDPRQSVDMEPNASGKSDPATESGTTPNLFATTQTEAHAVENAPLSNPEDERRKGHQLNKSGKPFLLVHLGTEGSGSYILSGDNVELSGGCNRDFLSLEFRLRESAEGDLKSFGFRTGPGVRDSKLETFDVPEIFVETMQSAPSPAGDARTAVKPQMAASLLGGQGTLMLSEQNTGLHSSYVRGNLSGTVAALGGLADEKHLIKAEFRAHVACD